MMSLLNEKPVTFEEFKKMEADSEHILEYIDGLVFMAPSPSIKHQRISSILHGELYLLLKNNKKCNVFSAPTDVILQSEDTSDTRKVVPDLLVICNSEGFIRKLGLSPSLNGESLSCTYADKKGFILSCLPKNEYRENP